MNYLKRLTYSITNVDSIKDLIEEAQKFYESLNGVRFGKIFLVRNSLSPSNTDLEKLIFLMTSRGVLNWKLSPDELNKELGLSLNKLLPEYPPLMFISLMSGRGDIIGISIVGMEENISVETIDTISAANDIISFVISNKIFEYETTKTLRKLKAVNTLQKAFNVTLDQERLFPLIIDLLTKNLQAEVGALLIFGNSFREVKKFIPWGIKLSHLESIYVISKNKEVPLINFSISKKGVFSLSSTPSKSDFIVKSSEHIGIIKSLLVAPLKIKEKVVGLLILANKTDGENIIPFNSEDEQIVDSVTVQIAVLIENIKLYDDVVAAREFTSSILESIKTGVITTHLNGEITYANSGACQIFEISPERIIGKGIEEIFGKTKLKDYNLDPEHINVSQTPIKGIEVRFTSSKTGKKIILSISVYPLKWKENTVGLVWIVDDITEKKEFEERMKRADRLAAIGELSAGIAHEIKNPLTSIKGFIDLLKEKKNDPAFLEKFTTIVTKEVDRLNNLIERFLSFARPRVGEFKKVDIINVLKTALEIVHYNLQSNQITLEEAYENRPTIYGNPDQLLQVFLNIIINAIQAMPNGGTLEIKVHTEEKHELHKGKIKYAVISFKDTGVGIPEEIIPKMFNPFFTTKKNGTGLGLAISHRLVSEHGGFIEIESEKNIGTTVRVYLPSEIQKKDVKKMNTGATYGN